ncbi:hypothetical protein chiPu_0028346, partial [Chiloscyllium punctatum]|nr:hypothetical protein [Chiloscyllium punctatum]
DVAGDHLPDILLAQIGDAFRAEPPVEHHGRRLRQRKQHDAIEVQERQEPRGHRQRVAREIGLREYLAEQRDGEGREQERAHAGQHRVRQQRQQHVGGDIAPDDGGEDLIRMPAKLEHARRVGIAAVRLDLQPQQAEAEDREIEAGEQCRLQDAGGDPDPGRDDPKIGHGCPGSLLRRFAAITVERGDSRMTAP